MKEQKNSRPAGTGTTANAKSTKTLHKYYSTSKSRMQAVFLAFICTLVIIMFFLIAAVPKNDLVPVAHKVREGECLWNIAQLYKPDNVSMSQYMDWVYEHNDRGFIYPGDTVIMGVYEND